MMTVTRMFDSVGWERHRKKLNHEMRGFLTRKMKQTLTSTNEIPKYKHLMTIYPTNEL